MKEKEYDHKDMLQLVKDMDNKEREKFLHEMFYEYFNPSNHRRKEVDWT